MPQSPLGWGLCRTVATWRFCGGKHRQHIRWWTRLDSNQHSHRLERGGFAVSLQVQFGTRGGIRTPKQLLLRQPARQLAYPCTLTAYGIGRNWRKAVYSKHSRVTTAGFSKPAQVLPCGHPSRKPRETGAFLLRTPWIGSFEADRPRRKPPQEHDSSASQYTQKPPPKAALHPATE